MSQPDPDPEPATIVIFGASGDLTQRKLVPALHSLDCEGLLPADLRVLGLGRSELSDDEFRDHLRQGVEEHGRLKPRVWAPFAERLSYLSGGYGAAETYGRLQDRLAQHDRESGTGGNAIFYMAVPPVVFGTVVEELGRAGLAHDDRGWRRVIVEKPFGHDGESARELNQRMHAVFREDQIYRIDHYLGKETVQNIMTFRFANAIFEPLWSRKYVDHVQISVTESMGVGHRGEYYDRAGVLRDMFQNHLLQLLTLSAMEPPAVWEANALRDEKVKVLRAVRPVERSVRGQYRGYRDEVRRWRPEDDPESQTATYAALQVLIDNWRWHGVPFYLRSGKQLPAKSTEIAIQFHHVPHLLFPLDEGEEITPDVLSLCIQPDEGIHLRFETKKPGAGMRTRSVEMDFHYGEDLAGSLPDAYERLLLDAIQGDASLFARADEIELAWSLIDPVLARWHEPGAPSLELYDPDAWGPPAADDFLLAPDRHWLNMCGGHD